MSASYISYDGQTQVGYIGNFDYEIRDSLNSLCYEVKMFDRYTNRVTLYRIDRTRGLNAVMEYINSVAYQSWGEPKIRIEAYKNQPYTSGEFYHMPAEPYYQESPPKTKKCRSCAANDHGGSFDKQGRCEVTQKPIWEKKRKLFWNYYLKTKNHVQAIQDVIKADKVN